MKTTTTPFKNHLLSDVTTICYCLKITRRDGAIFGLTDLDRDIIFAGVTYYSLSGFKKSSIETNDSFDVDNLTIEGILNSGFIEGGDIRKGLFDYAEVELFMINYNDVSMGSMFIRVGWLGEVTMNQKGVFTAEVRGLNQTLHTIFGSVYAPGCNADLGDNRCQVNLATFTSSGTVTQIDSGTRVFRANALVASDGYFNYGGLKFTSGLNSGRLLEVKNYVNATRQFEMFLSFPFQIALGDTFDVYAGCNKNVFTCRDKFNNVFNFRGEPYIPGMDQISAYNRETGL